jgi:hypothetical protein
LYDGEGISVGTHSVGDAIGESHKLDLVARALPVGEEGQDQAQCGGLGVGRGIGEGDVAQGGSTVGGVGGTHGGQRRGAEIERIVGGVFTSGGRSGSRNSRW